MAFDLETAPGHLIRRAQQRHQALWTEIIGPELTSVQFAVLALLAREPELDQRTLAVRTSTDTSTLADVCRRLEQRGLLRRDRDAGDQRRNVLSLAPAGEDLLARVSGDVERVGAVLLADLAEDERASLLALLARVL